MASASIKAIDFETSDYKENLLFCDAVSFINKKVNKLSTFEEA